MTMTDPTPGLCTAIVNAAQTISDTEARAAFYRDMALGFGMGMQIEDSNEEVDVQDGLDYFLENYGPDFLSSPTFASAECMSMTLDELEAEFKRQARLEDRARVIWSRYCLTGEFPLTKPLIYRVNGMGHMILEDFTNDIDWS